MNPKIIKENNRIFKKLSPFYDSVTRMLLPLREAITKQLIKQKAVRVVDLACGTGTQAELLVKRGIQVVGVDVSPAMLAIARKKVKSRKARFIKARADKTGLPSASFDAAVISFVLHEIPAKPAHAVIMEAKRLVKKKGIIAIAEYNSKDLRFSIWNRFFGVIFEGDAWSLFMERGLDYYLRKAKLKPYSDQYFLFKNLRLV